jgi:16S rRNA (guanine966-N2)-methyltransferase
MRVIAGYLGGRRLVAPPGSETRPTSDRVREAMFSILGDVEGKEVLDLYAGTGALGIEALSRGAVSATFVEHARRPLAALRHNLRQLDLESRARVVAARVERVLSAPPWTPATFDLVFLDPPYASMREGLLGRDAARALDSRLADSLRVGGRIVIEHAASDAAPILRGMMNESTRKYGDTALSFYFR